MAEFALEFTAEARKDLRFYAAREQQTILAKVKEQLRHEPQKETRNRKKLRDSPLAPWELRVGEFRGFYAIEESTVVIVAVGAKEHSKLFVRGKEVKL